VTAGARVQITVEIWGLGSWGPECQIDQIHIQATEAARNRVIKALGPEGQGWRTIETPKVEAVITAEERS
jgi:hypothetical protein